MSAALAEQALAIRWPCFPCDGEKRPIVKSGFKAASSDRKRIWDMFCQPGAEMIGVPTGPVSGVVVVDIDVRDGQPGEVWLEANRYRLPATRTHMTRSGGQHLLFRQPANANVRNSAGKIAPGVDVRGDGGYIIIPPSPGYVVLEHRSPAEMPDWLLTLVMPKAPPVQVLRAPLPPNPDRAARTLHRAVLAVAGAGEGGRNDTLNRQTFILATRVAAGLLARDTVMSELYAAALQAGLTDLEIRKTLESGFSAGLRFPYDPA